MSNSFTTISSLNASTISKPPAYANAQAPAAKAEQPVAAASMYDNYSGKKKSHWFAKTLAAVVIVVGGLAAARHYSEVLKKIDVKKELPKDSKFMEQAKYYTAKAGDFVLEKGTEFKKWCTELFSSTKKDTSKAK